MQLPDIWQAIGSSQVAEITALAGTAISTTVSIILARQGRGQLAPLKKIILN